MSVDEASGPDLRFAGPSASNDPAPASPTQRFGLGFVGASAAPVRVPVSALGMYKYRRVGTPRLRVQPRVSFVTAQTATVREAATAPAQQAASAMPQPVHTSASASASAPHMPSASGTASGPQTFNFGGHFDPPPPPPHHTPPSAFPSVSGSALHKVDNTFIKAIKMSNYDGSGDVERWLFKAQDYLRVAGKGWDDAQCLFWLGSYLSGAAQEWYISMRLHHPVQTFDAFASALLREFGDLTAALTARDDISRLRQGDGTAVDYTRRFRRLALQCKPLMQFAEEAHAYIRGLRPALQKEILVLQAKGRFGSLSDITTAAQQLDTAQRMSESVTSSASASNHNKPSSSRSSGQDYERRQYQQRRQRLNAMGADTDSSHPFYLNEDGTAKAFDSVPSGQDPADWHQGSGCRKFYKLVHNGEDLCFNCKGYGHRKNRCPKNNRRGRGSGNKGNDSEGNP